MKALIVLANGSEEKEAMSCATILHRAGVKITLAGVGEDSFITGASGVRIGVDTDIKSVDISSFDAIILPGGMDGMRNSANCKELLAMIKTMADDGKLVAAMCASPIVLDRAGLSMKEFTCYPSLENELLHSTNYTSQKTSQSDNIITGKGPALSDDFALALVAYLCTDEVCKRVKDQILF